MEFSPTYLEINGIKINNWTYKIKRQNSAEDDEKNCIKNKRRIREGIVRFLSLNSFHLNLLMKIQSVICNLSKNVLIIRSFGEMIDIFDCPINSEGENP